MALQKLQSLIFDISESIPNGKYIEIMDEMLILHNYIKEFDTNSESDFIMDFDAFDLEANKVINSYYDEECDEWIFDYSLIIRLKNMNYTPEYIARNLNWFFHENSYFYCPVYDILLYSGDYLLANFIESDAAKYSGHPYIETYYEADLKSWVEQRFKNAIEGL
jgi:hypothetical protein